MDDPSMHNLNMPRTPGYTAAKIKEYTEPKLQNEFNEISPNR